MATIKQSAYSSVVTVMTTELNSLANAATAVASTATDNTTNLDIFADVELVCSYALAPTVGSTMDLYLIPSIDGTNYADGSVSVAIAKLNYVGGFELRAVTTQQRVIIRNISIPPGKFFWAVVNNGGQALVSTNNTLKHATHNMTSI